jgi:DNA modification methylase
MTYELIHGDCVKVLREIEDNSVDAVATDPPYGLHFMQSKWDYDVPSVEIWKEALRVLKPGGHLLSFAGSRTYHRMAVNIEDAGFEIRDQIMWVYGSGFPKSLNISKAIDKAADAERTVIGRDKTAYRPNAIKAHMDGQVGNFGLKGEGSGLITAPATPEAEQWAGWGSALKPAHEPIVVARKPLIGTIVENVLEHGTGGLNIDGCRVETDDKLVSGGNLVSHSADERTGQALGMFQQGTENTFVQNSKGRFPANFIHDGSDEVVSLFPEETARFFYCAKASKEEKNTGLEYLADVERIDYGGFHSEEGLINNGRNPANRLPMKNPHPTVKPVDLMKYLCRLITPPNGVVLDPFMGSGTTGIAATTEGFNFIGIEREEEYIEIARHRIAHWVEEKEEALREKRRQTALF